MNLDEAAYLSGFSSDWLADAIARGLIRARTAGPMIDVPDDEVTFLRRSSRWLPHLIDAVFIEDIGSAILFGRYGAPTAARARDSMLLTSVDDPERALDLNASLSIAARREIYVVTWSSGTSQPSLARDAAINGRVLRDEASTWRRFVERELTQSEEPAWRSPAERDRLRALLKQWALADVQD